MLSTYEEKKKKKVITSPFNIINILHVYNAFKSMADIFLFNVRVLTCPEKIPPNLFHIDYQTA